MAQWLRHLWLFPAPWSSILFSWICQQNLILASFLDNYLPWICFFLSISPSFTQYFMDSQGFSCKESTLLYRLIEQNRIPEFPSKHSVSGNPAVNSQAWYIPTSLSSSKDSEILSTTLEIQFHTHSFSPFRKLFPSTGLLTLRYFSSIFTICLLFKTLLATWRLVFLNCSAANCKGNHT